MKRGPKIKFVVISEEDTAAYVRGDLSLLMLKKSSGHPCVSLSDRYCGRVVSYNQNDMSAGNILHRSIANGIRSGNKTFSKCTVRECPTLKSADSSP